MYIIFIYIIYITIYLNLKDKNEKSIRYIISFVCY
jgi:hypothetical protein